MKDTVKPSVLKKKYGNEQVLVVPALRAAIIPDGFTPKISQQGWQIFKSTSTFVYRYSAEYNTALVQLIPYVIVTNAEQNKLYVTERIAGEERLKSKLSLGAGGHVNPQDLSKDTMYKAAVRELNEELTVVLEEGTDLTVYGTVRDLQSDTREHLGLVYLATAAKVKVKEKDTLRGQWMDIAGLVTNYNKFESWACLVIDHLFVNVKEHHRLFKPLRLTEEGGRNYDTKRKETFRKNS